MGANLLHYQATLATWRQSPFLLRCFWKNKKGISWAQFGAISQNIRVLPSKAVKDTSLCWSRHSPMATILFLIAFWGGWGRNHEWPERVERNSGLRTYCFLLWYPPGKAQWVEDTILMVNSLAHWSCVAYSSLYPVIPLKSWLCRTPAVLTQGKKSLHPCVFTYSLPTQGEEGFQWLIPLWGLWLGMTGPWATGLASSLRRVWALFAWCLFPGPVADLLSEGLPSWARELKYCIFYA